MPVRVACAQIDCKIGSTTVNRQTVIERMREAATAGARLVIFPECALTGYCFDSLQEAAQFAEPLNGESSAALHNACLETGVYAIVGFIEKADSGLFNA